jgi:C-terminal region of Mon2 protein
MKLKFTEATTDVFFLQWNISDYFYQNQDKLSNSLNGDEAIFPEFPGTPNMPPFDKLWMCLYARLGAIFLQD